MRTDVKQGIRVCAAMAALLAVFAVVSSCDAAKPAAYADEGGAAASWPPAEPVGLLADATYGQEMLANVHDRMAVHPDVDWNDEAFRRELDVADELSGHVASTVAAHSLGCMADALWERSGELLEGHLAEVARIEAEREAARLAEEEAARAAAEAAESASGGWYGSEWDDYTPEPVQAVSALPGDVDWLRRMGVVTDSTGKTYTWYSQNVLPGGGLAELNANGRHVEDGLVKDADGYIAIAAPDSTPIGTVIETDYGEAKVYDYNSGSTWDVYTDF